VVEAARSYPVLISARRCNALDVVAVQANGLRRDGVGRGRSPYLYGDIRGCRDERLVVLGEYDVIDPVRVRLDLAAELRRRRLVGGRIGVGEGVAFFVALGEVEVEVPCAYDAVAAARVAGVCQSP